MSSSPSVVLVHGALTDASVWHRVIPLLQDAGVPVIAPVLPMRSFDSDIAYLRAFLETMDGPLLVVGHSYAGSVISAPDAVTVAVRGLVFVAAFQPEAGETSGELNSRFPGTQLVPDNLLVRPYPDGVEVYLRPELFGEVYANGVDSAHVAAMAAAQRPFDPVTLDGAFEGEATWRALPSWAVVSTEDVSIPTEALRFMAARAGSQTVETASGHAVPVSRPEVVADTIRAALDELGKPQE